MRTFLLTGVVIPVITAVSTVHAQSYVIENKQVIPLEMGDEIVGQIADMTRDAEGNFYLPDWQQHTVWVTDPKGKLIRRIGQEGSGPGELANPLSVSLPDDRLLVLDSGNTRIAAFTKEGTHLVSHRINVLMPSGMILREGGEIAVPSLVEPSLFSVFDINGDWKREGGERDFSGMPPLPLGGAFQHVTLTPDGFILYSPVKRYEVMKLDWDGAVLANYSAEPPGYVPFFVTPTDRGFRLDNTWSWIFRPLVLGENILIQRRKRLEDGGFRFRGDLFTHDGTLVQPDIDLPFIFVYTNDRDLYAIDTLPVEEGEPNPHIVVYRLSGGP